jgi:NAD(P)-dependent dehydrogenase (short-subunit alcohol dehydrogenase family)
MASAIVTDGNAGIGRVTAVLLAERGFDVGLTYASRG